MYAALYFGDALHVWLSCMCFFTFLWFVSVWVKDASIVDIFWSLGFLLAATLYLNKAGSSPRSNLVFLMVAAWSVRLAAYLAMRNLGKGEDRRYKAMRVIRPKEFWIWSLYRVFWLQCTLMMIIGAPLYFLFANPGPLNMFSYLGAAVWALGMFWEVVGDFQMQRFKSNKNNKAKVMRLGLWRFTRHPNYFGEAIIWWGFYICALGVPYGWLSFFGPLLLNFFLLKVSGVSMLENDLRDRKPDYRAYIKETPAFIPFWGK